VGPDQQLMSGRHRPWQPAGSVREPPNHSRHGRDEPADLDTDLESSSVRDTADYVGDAVLQEPSGSGPWNEDAALATHQGPNEAAKSTAEDAIISSPRALAEADQIPPGSGNAVSAPAKPQRPSARGMALPPWTTPTSATHGLFTEKTSPREPPAAASAHDAMAERPPLPQPAGFPPPGASRPPPPPPPGGPPGVPARPPWWPPPPGWPPVQPGTPSPGWQRPSGGGAESPPTRSHTPMPPEVERVQTFRIPPSLDEANVVDHRKYTPRSGWRRAVQRATRGHVDPGDSHKDHAQEDLLDRIRQSIVGDFRIAVLSIKGGVGKTTTTLGLGSALATARRDRVIAVDANPDRGTLAERVRDVSTSSTVRDLLSDPNISRYADIRNHTRMAVSRLEVLASEQDPAAADVFDEADYRRTIDILGHYYNIILTDCGTGIMHSAMAGVLDLAHTIVLVSSPAIDAVRSASATLEWLMRHGHSGLVGEGHVVLSASRPGSATLKMDKVYEFFEARCRSIHFVPFDPHLAEGADVDFGLLKPATRQAYLELAGAVAENFPRLRADRSYT
jgi:MinD-like ATPase involved in chromosome partitioning or flagellar assembly